MLRSIVCFAVFGLGVTVWGDVAVYSYPDVLVDGDLGINRRSELYRVLVSQDGEPREAYVMYDWNQERHHGGNLKANPDHHWTNFSFSGEVEVVVERLDGVPIEACTIYPLKKAVSARVENGRANFTIRDDQLPLQLWVDVGGPAMQVLLIFADPEETDVPDLQDPAVTVIQPGDSIESVYAALEGPSSTIVFKPGIHRWGDRTDRDYPGYRMPILEGKRIYIPGGAYVIGTFEATNQSHWKVYGRGVISACGLERLPGPESIPFSMVHGTGETEIDQVMEGFVSVCPPHFNLTVRGQCVIDNVKMFGWWHQTDGTVTGDRSIVRNCFFKVMDDFIKVYSDHCYHENNTMFQGMNGAPFQFSWSNQNGDHNVMKDTYIVYSGFKQPRPIHNTTVINARRGRKGNVTENNLWDGLYIDNGCHGFIGLNALGGTYRHFTIKDVELRSGTHGEAQFGRSYLVDGDFEDIRIINMTLDGNPVVGTDPKQDKPEEGLLWVEGEASALSFK